MVNYCNNKGSLFFLPLTREVAFPSGNDGGRDYKKIAYKDLSEISLPQSASLTAPSSEGAMPSGNPRYPSFVKTFGFATFPSGKADPPGNFCGGSKPPPYCKTEIFCCYKEKAPLRVPFGFY